MVEKKASLYWHIKSIEDYNKEVINPFGLRLQIFPSFEKLKPEFKIAWEDVLKQCSTALMMLLITEYVKRINVIDAKIDTLNAQITRLKTCTLFKSLEKKFKDHLKNKTKTFLSRRIKKFYCDKKTFREERVYKWNDAPKGIHRNNSYNTAHSANISKQSSSLGNSSQSALTQSEGQQTIKTKQYF